MRVGVAPWSTFRLTVAFIENVFGTLKIRFAGSLQTGHTDFVLSPCDDVCLSSNGPHDGQENE
ncbi:hypothetical protein JOD17_003509 [Geomicrobium sediminis]|uniref:Uncharacterized protein n=1 Tax=Geomicrobium sediminis TaxID=1347788 RepID=A0ABS2PG52_9BACL|nr:hypothetical protein [Geomicrobium sediminis]MBM7634403.1 hypothetical protein [Geomicrobium sediminis]